MPNNQYSPKLFFEKTLSYIVSIWPKWLNNIFVIILNNIYSEWKKRQLHSTGTNSYILPYSEIKGGENIVIGNNSGFSHHSILTTWVIDRFQKDSPEIHIGNDCHFGEFNHLTAINSIRIGNDVLTGRWVTITDNSHGRFSEEDLKINPVFRPLYSKGSVVIGDRVWIGDKVTILPGVSVGNGCIIAANTVVTKSFPENCIIAGNPGIIVKQLH